MEMKQVSDNCFAVLIEKNRVCDANSGLINRGGGVVIDTQSDLAHARQMIEMFSKVWPTMPRRVINTVACPGAALFERRVGVSRLPQRTP